MQQTRIFSPLHRLRDVGPSCLSGLYFRAPLLEFEAAKHAGLRQLKCAKSTIVSSPVGFEKGLDSRVPCSLEERPTDQDAAKNCFKNAKE